MGKPHDTRDGVVFDNITAAMGSAPADRDTVGDGAVARKAGKGPAQPAQPRKGAFQRMTMRVNASPAMTARGFRPWENSVALVTHHAKKWEAQQVVGAGEAENYSSVLLASEVILRQIYTETGVGDAGDGCVGGPHRRRTAVACVLLYHITQKFGRYKELAMALLRDLLESVYKNVDHDASALWDALTAPPGEAFFRDRAMYLADTFVERATYFDESREMHAVCRRVNAKLSQLHANRDAHNAAIERLLRGRDVALLRRVLSWWWTYVRLEKMLLVGNARLEGQMRAFARRFRRTERQRLLSVGFRALQREGACHRRRHDRAKHLQHAEERSELQLKLNEALTAEGRYKACLGMWQGWADGVIGVPEDWDMPYPPRSEKYKAEYLAVYKRRFEKMTAVVAQNLLAKADKASSAPQEVPAMSVDAQLKFQVPVSINHEDHNRLNYLSVMYATCCEGKPGMSIFDVMRFCRDVGIVEHEPRSAVLNTFLEHAQACGDDSGLWVPLAGVHELYVHIALAVQEEAGSPGSPTHGGAPPTPLRVFLDEHVTPNLASLTEAQPLDQYLRHPKMFSSFVKYGKVVMMYSMKIGRTQPEEYLASLGIPHLHRDHIDQVFREVRSGRAQVHRTDWLVVAASLAQCHDPLPYREPHDKFVTFFRLLMDSKPQPSAPVRGKR